MIILTNGYQLPEDGDLGDIWFDALEANIQRLNDHKHNGLDSAKLSTSSIEALSSTIDSADFTLVSGEYQYDLTLPPLILLDTSAIEFRDATTRDRIYLKYEMLSVSQIRVFSNTPVSVIVVAS